MIVLLVVLVGSLPAYPYSRRWGYYPFGGVLGFILLLVLILWLAGYFT